MVVPSSYLGRYPARVAVEKLSLSIDANVIARARQLAAKEGMTLSSWISRATERAVETAEGVNAMAAYLEEFGSPDAETLARVEQMMAEVGYGEPEPTER